MADGRVNIVDLGTNRFVDCRALIGYQGTQVLAVHTSPLAVALRIPADIGQDGTQVVVENCSVLSGRGISISRDERSFAIYAGESLVAVALLRDGDTAYRKLDVRALGMQIYDDIDGLHIGANLFARNEIHNAAVAIALG